MTDLIQIPGIQFITRLGDDKGLFDPRIPSIGEADADIKIGGDSNLTKFIPNINIFKWASEEKPQGEYFLNINTIGVQRGDVKSFKHGKVVFEKSGVQHCYYPTTEKRPKLEYEMVFASKPPSLEIQFDILCSDGLQFLRQDINVQRLGSIFALNVPGSYAVYVPKRNNHFRTGKFCHLYMPELIDAVGQRRFVEDFQIENGVISIVLPGTWMSNAIYPVTLDPTIGYTSEGSGFYANASVVQVCNYQVTTDGSGGDASTIHIWTEDNTLGSFKTSVYDAASEGDRVFVSYTVPTGSQNDDNWTLVDVSGDAGKTLAASTAYPIGFISDAGGHGFKYDTGDAGSSYYQSGQTYGDYMLATLPVTTIDTWIPSFYVTYEAAGGDNYNVAATLAASFGTSQSGTSAALASLALANQSGISQGGVSATLATLSLSQLLEIDESALAASLASVDFNSTYGISQESLATALASLTIANYLGISNSAIAAAFSGLTLSQILSISQVVLGGDRVAFVTLSNVLSIEQSALAVTLASITYSSDYAISQSASAAALATLTVSFVNALNQIGVSVVSATLTLAIQSGINISVVADRKVALSLATEFGVSSNAQAEAEAGLTLDQLVGIALTGKAIALAGLTLSNILSIEQTAATTLTRVTTPDERIFTITVESRHFMVEEENRHFLVPEEDRHFKN